MDSPTVEQRVQELAKTLRSTGIAASETRATEMARDIVRTEKRQQDRLDKRRESASLNPGKRVQSAPKDVSYSIDDSIDQEKPISELLQEDAKRENTAALKRPESFTATKHSRAPDALVAATQEADDPPVLQAVPVQKEKEAPTPQLQSTPQRVDDTSQPVQSQSPAPAQKEHSCSFSSCCQTTPTPQLSGANPAQKAFGLMKRNAQEVRKADSKPAQKPKTQKPKKAAAEEKVDLSEMFNFSKK